MYKRFFGVLALMYSIGYIPGYAAAVDFEAGKQLQEEKLSNKTREELYREIFNMAPPEQIKEVEAVLIINEIVNGKVDVVFSEDRLDFTIPSAPILTVISSIATPEFVKMVKDKVEANGRISQHVLDGLNLTTAFDSRSDKVKITVPTIFLLKQTHYLTGGGMEDPYVVESIKPNAVSAYVNIHVNQQFQYRQKVSENLSRSDSLFIVNMNRKVRQPFYGHFDGALNVYHTVLEGSAGFQQNADPAVIRNDIRLVYDQPQRNALRIMAGDILYPTIGYQSFVHMGGIGASKDYSLQPHILTYPVGEYEFYLTDPAEVEVWVNDAMVSRMYLDAGTHDIRGYPFIAGNNDVKIVTKDFAGRKETMEFSSIYETALLAKGISRYSANVGFPSHLHDGGYDYDVEKPFVSFSYQGAVSNVYTHGYYTQAFPSKGILGYEFTRATPLGPLALNTTGSYINKIGPSFATRLGFTLRSSVFYKYSKNKGVSADRLPTPVIWNTQAEYFGPKFLKNFEDTLIRNLEALKFSSDVTIPLAGQFNVSIAGRYYLCRDTVNVTMLSLTFQKTWKNALRTSATIQHASDLNARKANSSIIFSAQWSFRAGPNDFSVGEIIRRHQPSKLDQFTTEPQPQEPQWDYNTSFQWNYDNTKSAPERVSASVAAQLGPDNNDYRGTLGYSGNQGSIELSQAMDDPTYAKGTFLQHQTALSLKTALVYVDKTVCLSRPIYGGFVVAKGIKNLSQCQIMINPTDQGYEAISNKLGPAVLPFYTSYQLKRLKLTPLNPPIGSVEEKMDFTLFPQYKSGFLLSVGAEKTVLVFGSLLDIDGSPFAYQAIIITSRDKKDAQPTKTFTNGAGRFQFMGLGTGTYLITPVEAKGRHPITFDIPVENNGYYRSPTMTFSGSGAPLPKRKETVDSVDTAPQGENIFLLGTLASMDGKVLAFVSITIVHLDDPNAQPMNTFTNKDGGFQIVCRKPGHYKIAVADDESGANAVFTIPVGTKGAFDIGKQTLKK